MKAAFIGVDWGTSNARFMLVDAGGTRLEEKSGPGIAHLSGTEAIEAACFLGIQSWQDAHGPIPVIMAGMVGSNIGWCLAPYVSTPATPENIIAAMQHFVARDISFMLVPGVSTTRRDGLPDVMRGEETQILGCADDKDALFCLPGTHAKWAEVKNSAINSFHTALTGELLDIIGNHSILLNPKRAPHASVGASFWDAVAIVKQSALGLEALLFTTRSRQIMAELQNNDAESYLAGLCIGADIKSALSWYGNTLPVMLVGSPALTTLYAAALSIFGCSSRQIEGRDAVLSGLYSVYCLSQTGNINHG